MSSFHTVPSSKSPDDAEQPLWQPISPPSRGAGEGDRANFHAYMLMPGFSMAFHAATLGRSRSSIATYRRQAQEAALAYPAVTLLVLSKLGALTVYDGLQMAQCRGKAQLPHWSLLAMCEFRERGHSRREIAAAFRCSPGTVAHALQFRNRSYEPLSGARRLTAVQRRPPGQFTERMPK